MVENVTIEHLKSELAQYRKNKSRKNQPIPVEIWDQIRQASESISVSNLSHELNLDLGGLKKKLARGGQPLPSKSEAKVSVVKVCAESPVVNKSTKATLVCPRGWSLSLEGMSPKEVIQAFQELRHGGE